MGVLFDMKRTNFDLRKLFLSEMADKQNDNSRDSDEEDEMLRPVFGMKEQQQEYLDFMEN